MMRMHFPDVEHDYRAGRAAARAALGASAFATAWTGGQAMPLEQAVADALEEPDDGA
jgi:hypothetical protein